MLMETLWLSIASGGRTFSSGISSPAPRTPGARATNRANTGTMRRITLPFLVRDAIWLHFTDERRQRLDWTATVREKSSPKDRPAGRLRRKLSPTRATHWRTGHEQANTTELHDDRHTGRAGHRPERLARVGGERARPSGVRRPGQPRRSGPRRLPAAQGRRGRRPLRHLSAVP